MKVDARSRLANLPAMWAITPIAEFERELIRARTGEGRERAKERGVHIGEALQCLAEYALKLEN